MTVRLGIACEDRGHFVAVTTLVDRTLLAAHDWLNGVLDTMRTWCGLGSGERWFLYDPEDARDLRPMVIDGSRFQPIGHIRGEPLKPEASLWRRVLLSFHQLDPRPEAVILVRDMDGYPERRLGMEQVRTGIPWPFDVVIAAPAPEVEAWHVSGFEPNEVQERVRLAVLRSELSFDPTTQSHRLTSHPNDAPTDAKQVLSRLCDDEERKLECLNDRARLRARGGATGLAAFLTEVDDKIVPRFGAA